MRFAIASIAILFGLFSPAHAQMTNCTANGPFLNCHTIGGNDASPNDGSGFSEGFRFGQEMRRQWDASRRAREAERQQAERQQWDASRRAHEVERQQWDASRRAHEAEQQQFMRLLYRMVQQANASVPADATPEQSLAIRSAALDQIHMLLTDSGIGIHDWPRVRANLLAHPEIADHAVAAMDGPIPPK